MNEKNLKPRTATAAVLHAFLSVAGFGLVQAFPQQMRKLMQALLSQMVPKLDTSNPVRNAATISLQQWLHVSLANLQQYGRFQEPKGRNMPDTQESDAQQQQVHNEDYHA